MQTERLRFLCLYITTIFPQIYVIWQIEQIVILRFINIKMNVISHFRSICYCYFVFDYNPRTLELIEQQKTSFYATMKNSNVDRTIMLKI